MTAFTLKPGDLRIEPMGIISASLGHAETEFVAALIIRWHHVNKHEEWQPFSRADIATLFDTDPVTQQWARNPFWKPDSREFMEMGFIEGWTQDPSVKGTLTDKFFAGLQRRIDADVKRAMQREAAPSPDSL
jgi:hypothetical protein